MPRISRIEGLFTGQTNQIQIQNIQEGLLLGQTDGQRSAGPTGLCGLCLNVPFPCDHDLGFT